MCGASHCLRTSRSAPSSCGPPLRDSCIPRHASRPTCVASSTPCPAARLTAASRPQPVQAVAHNVGGMTHQCMAVKGVPARWCSPRLASTRRLTTDGGPSAAQLSSTCAPCAPRKQHTRQHGHVTQQRAHDIARTSCLERSTRPRLGHHGASTQRHARWIRRQDRELAT